MRICITFLLLSTNCLPYVMLDIGVQILGGAGGSERVVSVTIDGIVRVFSIGRFLSRCDVAFAESIYSW